MIYAGAFRRGDGFYPMNAIFQQFMLLCIIWQGIDWLRQRRFVRGALAAAMPILWPFCIAALLTLFPKIQDAPIGCTVAIASGKKEDIEAAVEYLKEKNVGGEVIFDGRVSK